MLRTFLAGLGVVFALTLVFVASFLGRIAYDAYEDGPAYEALAVEITRKLSRNWVIGDISDHYAAAVAPVPRQRGAALLPLRGLGRLRYVDDIRHRTRWSRAALMDVQSPAEGAELVAQLLRKTVSVSFRAKFDNGFANVTMTLRSEGGVMKLWHLQIDSHDQLKSPRQAPVAISRA